MKQRLIGAAVLVALAVIFLPMLLDSPAPGPGTAAVRLDIPPAPDRDFDTRILPLEPPQSAAPAAAAPAPVAAGATDVLPTVDTDAAPRTDARPEDGAGVAEATGAAAGEPAAPSATPVAAAPQPPPAPVRDGQFAVNLGSFSHIANAEALLQRLKSGGIPAYGETIQLDGAPALRLRAGPFAARGDAEAARLAAQRVEPGLATAVVTLDAAAPAADDARSGFALQVGAFRDQGDALALRDRLRNGGLTAFIDEVRTEEGRLHRVRIGPETQRERAEALQQTVKQRFQLDGMVVTHP